MVRIAAAAFLAFAASALAAPAIDNKSGASDISTKQGGSGGGGSNGEVQDDGGNGGGGVQVGNLRISAKELSCMLPARKQAAMNAQTLAAEGGPRLGQAMAQLSNVRQAECVAAAGEDLTFDGSGELTVSAQQLGATAKKLPARANQMVKLDTLLKDPAKKALAPAFMAQAKNLASEGSGGSGADGSTGGAEGNSGSANNGFGVNSNFDGGDNSVDDDGTN